LARGRRVTYGSGGALGAPWSVTLLCVAGVALGDIYRRFAWQAWHLATSTLASVALMALGWLWWRAWGPLVAR